MKNSIDLKVVVEEPAKILELDSMNRRTFFVMRKHNSIDELSVIFNNGTLYFSSSIEEKAISKYARALKQFAEAKYINGKAQDKRYQLIKDNLGRDGEETALDMFRYYKYYKRLRK